jgi:equilibrative nucleoside transporter 1/2/3
VVLYGPRLPFKWRIVPGFLAFIVILIVMVLVRNFWLAVGLAGAIGFCDAIVQGSIYGLSGQFHPRFVGAVMSGNGVAGTIITLLRVFTKIIIPENAVLSGMIYFVTACLALVACIVVYIVVVLRSPVTRYYLEKTTPEMRTRFLTGDSSEQKPSSLWELFKKIWPEAVLVALNFWITLALFPGITAQMYSTSDALNKGQWFPIILFTAFNFFDLVGRTIPRWDYFIFFSRRTLWIPTVLRLAFLPLFILSLHPKFFVNDMWMYVFMSLMGLSNGYVGTLCMMFGPDAVEVKDKESAGTMMVFFLTSGLTAGVWTGTLIDYLITETRI